jgi:outer membrane protein
MSVLPVRRGKAMSARAVFVSLLLSSALIGCSAARAESIEEALASAYASNPQLEAQRAAQRATDELVPQALSAWKPTVSVNAGYATSNTIETLAGQKLKLDSRPLSAQVIAQQNLYTFGRVEGGIDKAEASVLAGRAQLNATEQGVLLAAASAYIDVVQAQSVVGLTKNNVDVLTRQLEATRDRFRVGEITRTDVAQADAALANANSDLIAAEATLTNAKAAYEKIVGHGPENVSQPKQLPALPATLDEAKATAATRSPTLIASRRSEEASRANIEVARSSLLPQLVAQGSYSYNDGATLGSIGQTLSLQTKSAQIGVQLQVPLNTSGLAYSQLRQAKQSNSQDRINIATAERAVLEAVVDAWENLRAARGQIESGRENVRANEVALDGVRQEAAVGSRTTLDVLNAEQLTLTARVNLVRAEHNEVVTAYQLLNAIGKLTPGDLSLSVKSYDPSENYKNVRDKWFGADVN